MSLSLVKQIINWFLCKFGYKMVKIYQESNIELYRSVYGEAAVKNRLFYNLGSGSFSHPAWTNIDHISDWYANRQGDKIDIKHDFSTLKPIPLQSDSALVLYTSHVVEHLDNITVQHLFNEAYRLLKKGGIFRITTPNIDLELDAYKRSDRHYFETLFGDLAKKHSIEQMWLYRFASSVSSITPKEGSSYKMSSDEAKKVFSSMKKEDALNYCIEKCSAEVQSRNPGNHINWFDENKLRTMLGKTGFENIYLSAYGQSKSPVLRNTNYFDKRPEKSIYIETIK